MESYKAVSYAILAMLSLALAMLATAAFSQEHNYKFVVERFTSGTAKIIELHERHDDVMQTYQVGRARSQCEGFRVLTGDQRGGCVVIYNDQNPRRRQ